MAENALKIIFTRNQYYRSQYLLALGALFLTYIVNATLVGVLIYVVQNPTEPLYFATDDVGRLIRVVPVSRPNMTTEDAAKWAIRAVEDSYSYDYVNYRRQLQHAQGYFTDYGWRKYMEALKASRNLVAVKQRKMIIEAKVVGSPVVRASGNLGGKYAWKFEMPVLLTNLVPPYDPQTDPQSRFANALNVTVIVQRQPILQSKNGLGVLQLVASAAVNLQQPGPQMSDVPTG